MTIADVVDPVMLPVAYGIAALAVVVLCWHVARRYPSAPKRVPMRINADGRPGRPGPKATLWLAPAVLAAVVVVLGTALVREPPKPNQHLLLALVMLVVAEVAWLAGWTVNRQIELARKMTYRIAPSRMLRVMLPFLATVAAVIAVAVHP